jgi:predicted acetyltransferase
MACNISYGKSSDRTFWEPELEKFSKFLSNYEKEVIGQWASEEFCELWYVRDKDISIGFALVGKMDFDPDNLHTNPYMLHYIFIIPGYRNQGYGAFLIKTMLKVRQLSLVIDYESHYNWYAQRGFIRSLQNRHVMKSKIE